VAPPVPFHLKGGRDREEVTASECERPDPLPSPPLFKGRVQTAPSGADYASPEVSNMAASIASRADLPAQTTNWKAW
jgi:hypothetical protein